MFDLEKAKIVGVNSEPFTEEPIETPAPEETPVIEETTSEVAPVAEEQKIETPANDFPTERFEGRFKSWEEVTEALNKPASQPEEFDDYLKNIINKYKSDGSLEDYFKAYSVDYDKLSDEEILKRDFFANNSDLSEKAAKKLWETELAKYKLDPEEHDEEDVEIASVKMKREANKLREAGKESQKQFIQPQRQVAPKASVEDLAKTVHAMPEAQDIKAKKTISFKVGDSVINYGVDNVDEALNLMADEEKFGALFLQNGRPNIEEWVGVIEWRKNKEKIIKTVYDQGLAAGQKLIEKEIRNPSLPIQQPERRADSGSFKDRFFEAIAAKTA